MPIISLKNMIKFGERIKELRKEKGLTQKQLEMSSVIPKHVLQGGRQILAAQVCKI